MCSLKLRRPGLGAENPPAEVLLDRSRPRELVQMQVRWLMWPAVHTSYNTAGMGRLET